MRSIKVFLTGAFFEMNVKIIWQKKKDTKMVKVIKENTIIGNIFTPS